MNTTKLSADALGVLNDLMEEADFDPFKVVQEYESDGICATCGHLQDCVEPDAEGYECSECGEKSVMGIENALLFHYL